MDELYNVVMRNNTFGIPRRILFGVNVVKEVGSEAKMLGVGKRGLIVTDPGY